MNKTCFLKNIIDYVQGLVSQVIKPYPIIMLRINFAKIDTKKRFNGVRSLLLPKQKLIILKIEKKLGLGFSRYLMFS